MATLLRAALATLLLAPVAPARAAASDRELVVMAEEDFLESWPVLAQMSRWFEAAHPGVHVRLLPLGGAVSSQHKGKFMLAGDVPLDVLRIDVTEIAAFQSENALIDLQPYFSADPSWDASAYFPQLLDAARDARGHLYGLPSTFTPYVLYVNQDLLAQIDPSIAKEARASSFSSWTWDDLVALARAATRDLDGDGKPDHYGISLTQWLQAVVPWVWQNGGDLLDARNERSRMAEPEFVEAMRFLRGLLHEQKIASFDASFANQMSQGLFQAGKALFYGPVGFWETFRFKYIRDFRWDVVPLPRRKTAATAVAMTLYVVPRTSRHPDLAYEFLRLLAGPRYQRTLAAIGNGVPGMIEAARSESFLDPGRPPASAQVFLEVMPTARFMPPLANWQKIESLCQSELEGILLVDGFDVEAGCRRMAAKTDAYLLRERERLARPGLPRGVMEGALAISILALSAGFLLGRGRRRSRLLAREERHGYGMIALWGAGFLFFLFGPAVVALVMAFAEWSPLRPIGEMRWAGVDNLARLATDGTFRASLGATASYALLSVPLGLALALALALLLRADTRASALVRTTCYVPAIVAPVIVGAVWRFVLEPDRGLLNRALALFGVAGPAWLRDPHWVVPAFVLMSLWSVGAQMLVFLAALKALDPVLDEAARMDGAGAWRRFRHVTLPQLTPVLLFNLVTGSIAAFQTFAQPYVMTEGGPGDASRFLVLYLYETAFRHLDMGYASVIGWVLFLLLALLCFLFLRSSRRWVYYAGASGAGRSGR